MSWDCFKYYHMVTTAKFPVNSMARGGEGSIRKYGGGASVTVGGGVKGGGLIHEPHLRGFSIAAVIVWWRLP
jgi:hypothetical protein